MVVVFWWPTEGVARKLRRGFIGARMAFAIGTAVKTLPASFVFKHLNKLGKH